MNTLTIGLLLLAVVFAVLALLDGGVRWGYRLAALSALLVSVAVLAGKVM